MSLPDNLDYIEDNIDERFASRAEMYFRQGFNCCESILQAGNEVFNLSLPDNVHLLGRLFREGTGAGCICGALAGGLMILGYMAGDIKNPKRIADKYRSKFIENFGSTCCRVIRKKQSITQRLTNTECRRITKVSAGLIRDCLSRGEPNEH